MQGAEAGRWAEGRLSRGARGAGAAGPPGRSAGLAAAAFPCWQPASSLCAPSRGQLRPLRPSVHRSERLGPVEILAPRCVDLRAACWEEPRGGQGGRWLRAGAARARPGAAVEARGGAGSPRRAPGRLLALMEPPWELELELRRHIETCACTCDHMGYGNYMDYQVAPAACMCRAITSPHAHVCVEYSRPHIRMFSQPARGSLHAGLFVVFTCHPLCI